MVELEPLERRVFACGWAPAEPEPHASEAVESLSPPADASGAESASAGVAVAAEVPGYNTPFLTDAQLEQYDSMTAAEIRAFLVSRGSYFRQSIVDVDGVAFDPATEIAVAAAQYRINPKVILTTLQKEHSGITRTTRPTDPQMRFLMGCVRASTAREQLACAAERFRSYQNSLVNNGTTISGWRVGVAKTTQDGVSVTPASRAVAGQFTYTPYAGVRWGGNQSTVGGVYLFYEWWTALGFADSIRPTAASNPGTYVAAGATTLTFNVTYADAAGVDASDVLSNNAAVRVTGPNGFNRLATFVSLSASTDGTPRVATYRLTPPGAAWDAADAGAYSVVAQEAQVSDVNNNFVRPGTIGTLTVVAPATVAGRHVFYNGSAFDGNRPGLDPADDAAVAPDKVALLPGQAAGFANVTSFTKGITGIGVDLRGAGDTVGAADVSFRVGNGADPGSWAVAPAPSAVLVRPGAGPGGATRLSIAWAEGAVRNVWLQVTVKANANTRLAAADVFYFGNLPGDAGGAQLTVDAADAAATRAAMSNVPAPIGSRADHNRDGRVDVRDLLAARQDQGKALYGLTAPAAGIAGANGATSLVAQAPTLAATNARTPRRRAAYVIH